MVRILFGFVLALILVPLVALAWIKYGNVPVAVADTPFPYERQITHMALNRRIDAEMPSTAPIQADEDNLVAGARIYKDNCAFCHGFHGKKSLIGANMFPSAPQLWERHHNGTVVGVSDDPPGETYWKVSNGIRLTGMPSYKKQLTDTQMWQVTLLLANADKPLPPVALDIVRGAPAQGSAMEAAPAPHKAGKK